jgi:putative ABC transport system permease protein
VIFRALVLGNLRENLLRSIVALIAVSLGVALTLAIDLANATAVRSFSRSVNVISNHVNLQVTGVGAGFDERTLLRIQAVSGVQSASPAVDGSIAFRAPRGDFIGGEVLHAIGLDVLQPLPKSDAPEVSEGATSPPPPVDLGAVINQHGIFVSQRLAQRFHLAIGSPLRAVSGDRALEFHVAGILPPNPGVDSSTVFVDIATAQETFGRIGLLSRIDLVVDPDRLAAVQKAVQEVVPPGARVVEPRVRTNEIKRLLRSFQLNLAALGYVALLVGMFLIYNTVAISVVQRKAEIGTLRAAGATRGQIVAAFIGEGALFGAAGSLIGIGLGCALAVFTVAAVTKTTDVLYLSTHADSIFFRADLILKAFVAGLVFSLISAIAPAIEAARTPPALAMRSQGVGLGVDRPDPRWLWAGVLLLALAYVASRMPAIDAIPVFGYFSALCILAGLSLCAPAFLGAVAALVARIAGGGIALRLAAANVHASVRRLGVAVAATMVAVGMVTSVAVLIGSFSSTIVAWSNEALRADLFLQPSGFQDASVDARFSPGVVQRLRAVPGIEAIDTFRAFTVPYGGGLITVGGTNLRSFGQRGKLRILAGEPADEIARSLPGSNQIIASDPFAVRYNLGVGDVVHLDTPSGPADLRIAAIYNDYSSDAGVLIMDTSTFSRLYHDDSVSSLAIYASPGTDLTALRSRLQAAAAPAQIEIATNRELRDAVLRLFNATFAITYSLDVIAIVIAALGVVSTLFALVLERRREIAIARYLGLSTGGVRSMILGEAAQIGMAGAVLGIVAGLLLGLLLVFVINRQAFGWLIELRVPWGALASDGALVVLTALLAGLYPAALAARIRTADALRAE